MSTVPGEAETYGSGKESKKVSELTGHPALDPTPIPSVWEPRGAPFSMASAFYILHEAIQRAAARHGAGQQTPAPPSRLAACLSLDSYSEIFKFPHECTDTCASFMGFEWCLLTRLSTPADSVINLIIGSTLSPPWPGSRQARSRTGTHPPWAWEGFATGSSYCEYKHFSNVQVTTFGGDPHSRELCFGSEPSQV